MRNEHSRREIRFWREQLLARSIALSIMICLTAYNIGDGNRFAADVIAATACLMLFNLITAFRYYRDAKRRVD